MRKFLLIVPEFAIKQKEVLSLGRAFLHYAYRSLADRADAANAADGAPVSMDEGARRAQAAAHSLRL